MRISNWRYAFFLYMLLQFLIRSFLFAYLYNLSFFISYKKINLEVFLLSLFGVNEVVIYNFLSLLTIDIKINQFIKVYHISDNFQYFFSFYYSKILIFMIKYTYIVNMKKKGEDTNGLF